MNGKIKVWLPLVLIAVMAGAYSSSGLKPGCMGGACLPLPFLQNDPFNLASLPEQSPPLKDPLELPGQTIPEFSGVGLAGETLTHADLQGSVAVVHFWATWCGPCMDELPVFRELQNQVAGHPVKIIGISLDEPGDPAVNDWWEKYEMNFPTLYGDDTLFTKFEGMGMLPHTVIYDSSGERIKIFVGQANEERLHAVIKDALSQPQNSLILDEGE